MPKKTYSLEPDGSVKLEMTWRGFWKDGCILFEGKEIAAFNGLRDLRRGISIVLGENKTVDIRFVDSFGYSGVDVLYNGKPVRGTVNDPRSRIKIAAGIIFFITALNIVTGLLTVFLKIPVLVDMGFGLYNIVFGLVFLVFGVFVAVLKSAVFLIIAVVLFAADGLIAAGLSIFSGPGDINAASIAMKVLLIIPMIRGIGPALDARKIQ